jgi:hypothetical protein
MPDLLKRLLASPESRFLLSNFATYGQTRPAGTACSTAVPRWFADTEQVTSWSVGGQARTEPEVGPTTVVDEAVVRTPNFTPDGRQRPAQTLVRTAVGCHLLARRCPPPGQSPKQAVFSTGALYWQPQPSATRFMNTNGRACFALRPRAYCGNWMTTPPAGRTAACSASSRSRSVVSASGYRWP